MNIHGKGIAVVSVFAALAATCAASDNYWLGGADPTLPEAWSDGVPTADDVIHLTADHVDNLSWPDTFVQTVAGWVQESGYSGTVTFPTSPSGSFQSLSITGDAVLSGGTWTHLTNGVSNAQNVWLKVSVGGDLTTASGFSFDVVNKGYSYYYNNSKNSVAGRSPGNSSGTGASHGGQGGVLGEVSSASCYDSYSNPTDLGSASGKSGGFKYGAGAILLSVVGEFRHDGSARASASDGNAAGGSISVTAGSLSGSGSFLANGGTASSKNWCGGGGGRIAIRLTSADCTRASFADRWSGSIFASGGANSNSKNDQTVYCGGAGTVYLEFAADEGHGSLVVDGSGVVRSRCSGVSGAAVLPSGTDAHFGSIAINTRGRLGLVANSRVTVPSFDLVASDGGEFASLRFLGGGELASSRARDELKVSNYAFEAYGAVAFPSGLSVSGTGLLVLGAWSSVDGNLTVRSLRLGSSRVAAGTYTAAQLEESYGYVSGNGTVVVSTSGDGVWIFLR